MRKELEALEKFLDDYLTLCEKLHTNRQEKMLLDKNSPYNVLKTYLEFINNADSSEALKKLEMLSDCAEAMKEAPSSNWIEYANNETELDYQLWTAYEYLKQALLNAEKDEKIILCIEDYLNQRIKVEPLEDVRKAFIEIRNQLQVIKEVVE